MKKTKKNKSKAKATKPKVGHKNHCSDDLVRLLKVTTYNARLDADLSAPEAAKSLGISESYLYSLEAENNSIAAPLPILERMAKLYKTTLAKLFRA